MAIKRYMCKCPKCGFRLPWRQMRFFVVKWEKVPPYGPALVKIYCLRCWAKVDEIRRDSTNHPLFKEIYDND